jgi:hypothetical protein
MVHFVAYADYRISLTAEGIPISRIEFGVTPRTFPITGVFVVTRRCPINVFLPLFVWL